jgi:hypothetical protein
LLQINLIKKYYDYMENNRICGPNNNCA